MKMLLCIQGSSNLILMTPYMFQVQNNFNQMSSAPFPQKESFIFDKSFCEVATHIAQRSCQDPERKFFLQKKYPKICQILDEFKEYFGEEAKCDGWPALFIEKNNKDDTELQEMMFKYGRDNLAKVQIFIQSPYVTKIKRDQEMTFTNFIANTGGLLGLCIGFSFISGIEIIYWLINSCTSRPLFVKTAVVPLK